MKFCALVAENQNSNKMSSWNIALVLAPNLWWPNTDDVKLVLPFFLKLFQFCFSCI